MKTEFENSDSRPSFLCRLPFIKIARIIPCKAIALETSASDITNLYMKMERVVPMKMMITMMMIMIKMIVT